jgi:hypothetical protein
MAERVRATDVEAVAQALERVERIVLEHTVPDHLKAQPQRQYMTAEQLAERLGMSTGQLVRLRLNGNGPGFIRCGRRVLYHAASVLRWEQSQIQTSTSKA